MVSPTPPQTIRFPNQPQYYRPQSLPPNGSHYGSGSFGNGSRYGPPAGNGGAPLHNELNLQYGNPGM